MEIKRVISESDVSIIIPVLIQLRGQYTEEELSRLIIEQMKNGYQLCFIENQSEVLSVIGFRIENKLAWGKHIYVDDFVTNESNRSTGAGRMLIEWLTEFAKEKECKQIHLDSGVQRFEAHKFYLRENFKIASHHFSITDL